MKTIKIAVLKLWGLSRTILSPRTLYLTIPLFLSLSLLQPNINKLFTYLYSFIIKNV